MAKVKKRIAKSGATTDGRKLPKDTLAAMSKNYDRNVYAARLNIEHYLSVYPDSLFSEQGDVLSLSTEPAPNNEIYLIAEMDTSSTVDDLWAKGKKRAFSIEYDPNFADIGQPYLVGLAVTSTPASLGTQFSNQQNTAAPNTLKFVFTENSVGFDDHTNYTVEHLSMSDPKPFTDDKSSTPPSTTTPPAPQSPDQFATALQQFSSELAAVRAERDNFKAECSRLSEDFAAKLAAKEAECTAALAAKDAEIDELKKQIPAEGYQFRPLATGNEGRPATRF